MLMTKVSTVYSVTSGNMLSNIAELNLNFRINNNKYH